MLNNFAIFFWVPLSLLFLMQQFCFFLQSGNWPSWFLHLMNTKWTRKKKMCEGLCVCIFIFVSSYIHEDLFFFPWKHPVFHCFCILLSGSLYVQHCCCCYQVNWTWLMTFIERIGGWCVCFTMLHGGTIVEKNKKLEF